MFTNEKISSSLKLFPTCGACLLLSVFLLAACGAGESDNLNSGAAPQVADTNPASGGNMANTIEGSIKANPNPVPGGEGVGKTTISWTTKGYSGIVKVYVSDNGQPEKVMAQAAEGSVEAPWILSGGKYDFYLYAESGDDRRLIDKIQVTRPN